MKINCVSCGHKVDLDDAYSDYEGPIKCFACSTLLKIRTEQGSLKSVKFLDISPHSLAKALGKEAGNNTH